MTRKGICLATWDQFRIFCVQCVAVFRQLFGSGPQPISKTVGDLLFPEESYRIMGACFEVYKEKGSGFLEPVYHDCLEIEMRMKGIPFRHEPQLPLSYKGVPLRRHYTPDFTCWDKIVVELKALPAITASGSSVELSQRDGLPLGVDRQLRASSRPRITPAGVEFEIISTISCHFA